MKGSTNGYGKGYPCAGDAPVANPPSFTETLGR